MILTPEPTSLTDAYALLKVLKLRHGVERFRVLINMSPDEKSAKSMFARLHAACDHFLDGVSLDYMGFIPRDTMVRKAVVNQTPFTVASPDCPASRAMKQIAASVQNWEAPENLDGNIKFFWKKLLFRS